MTASSLSDVIGEMFSKVGDSNIVGKFNAAVAVLSEKALGFLAEDPEVIKQAVKAVIEEVVVERRIYSTQNFVFGGIGMALMFFGALAAAYFAFKLLFVFFEGGVGWGGIFLFNFAGYVPPFFNELMTPILLVLHLLTLYFMATRWSSVRKPFVCHLFCLDVVLLGYFVLRSVP